MISIPEAVDVVAQRKLAWVRFLLGDLRGINYLDFSINIITKTKPLNLWPALLRQRGKLTINIPVVPREINLAMHGKIINNFFLLRKIYEATLN